VTINTFNGPKSLQNTLYLLPDVFTFVSHDGLTLKCAGSALILHDLGVFLQLCKKVGYFCNFRLFEG
jgi:hypothetical protein